MNQNPSMSQTWQRLCSMGTGATTRTVAGGGEADGVIPRSVKYIFAALAKIREHYDVSIKVADPPACCAHPTSAIALCGVLLVVAFYTFEHAVASGLPLL